jgi:hypothetical protein
MAADVSMTSALLSLWAVSGLKVPLGRKWPSGLGPSGPVAKSPKNDLDLTRLSRMGRLWPAGFGWAQNQLVAHLGF